jgi:SAM-dependent methyltransferase
MDQIFNKNWLVKKIARESLKNSIKKYVKGNLIDIGCGDSPYKELLAPYIENYTGLDTVHTKHNKSNIDSFSSAYDIPFENSTFDTVFCTAVLEHLEKPDKAIHEASRVLKTKGVAIYTSPLFWHIHEEPRDFFRYTKFGLKYIFEKNGFKIIDIQPLSGFIVTFGQELVYYIWRFQTRIKFYPLKWIIPFIGMLIQQFCYILNKYDNSAEFTWMYTVIAEKSKSNKS